MLKHQLLLAHLSAYHTQICLEGALVAVCNTRQLVDAVREIARISARHNRVLRVIFLVCPGAKKVKKALFFRGFLAF